MLNPSRGEVWDVNLDPVRGHEQGGQRPGLVISIDQFNHGPAELVIIVPITTKAKGIRFHVKVSPTEGGLRECSFIKCEDVRSLARERLSRRIGEVSPATLLEVEDRLRILQGL